MDRTKTSDTVAWGQDLKYDSKYIVLPKTVEDAVKVLIDYHLDKVREKTQIELDRQLALRVGLEGYDKYKNRFTRKTVDVDYRTRKYRDMDVEYWKDGKWLTNLNKSVHIIDYNLITLAEKLNKALQFREFNIKGDKYAKVDSRVYNSGNWPDGFVKKAIYTDGLPENWISPDDDIFLMGGRTRGLR